MSTRPEISGFRLSILHSLLGSGNTEAVTAVTAALDEVDDEDHPGVIQKAGEVIKRAIMEGAPFPDYPLEDEPHVLAITALAAHGQEQLLVDSNFWKMAAFWDLLEKLKGKIDDGAYDLLHHFEGGRPLLGGEIDLDGSIYGWLTLDEARKLKGALEKAHQATPDPTGDGFLKELIGWLKEITDQGLDLFFLAQ